MNKMLSANLNIDGAMSALNVRDLKILSFSKEPNIKANSIGESVGKKTQMYFQDTRLFLKFRLAQLFKKKYLRLN